jgi:hypothetical protein
VANPFDALDDTSYRGLSAAQSDVLDAKDKAGEAFHVTVEPDGKVTEKNVFDSLDTSSNPFDALDKHDWGTTDARDAKASKPKKQVKLPEAVSRAGREGGWSAGKVITAPFMGAASALDAIGSLVAGKPVTALEDVVGPYMENYDKLAGAHALKPDEEYSSKGVHVAANITKSIPEIGANLALGSPVMAAETQAMKAMPAVATLLREAIQKPVAAAVPMASAAGSQTFHELTAQGVDPGKAMLVASIEEFKALATGAAPLSTQGRVLSRAAQGVVQNVVQTKASANARNMVLDSEYPQLHYEPTDVDYYTAAGTGAALAVVLGRYRPETEASKARDTYDAIKKDLEAYKALEEGRQEFADAQTAANAAADKAAPVEPVKARIQENDAYAKQQGWTGQEPGIGKGEILEDVSTASARNPFMSEGQVEIAQGNVDAGRGPGYGEMGFQFPKAGQPVFPTEPDAALFKAISSAKRAAAAKGSLEKAQAKADAAADAIASDIVMAKEGVPLADNAPLVPEPKAPEQISAEQAFQNFLKVARKRQSGHLDLSGLGDNALIRAAEKVTKAAKATFQQMPARMGRLKYWLGENVFPWVVDKDGFPVTFFHGTLATEGGAQVQQIDPKTSTQAFEDFHRGDIGYHIGTVISAERFVNGNGFVPLAPNAPPKQNGGYIFPVFTNIKRPFITRDLIGWKVTDIINEIVFQDAAARKGIRQSTLPTTYQEAGTLRDASILPQKISEAGIRELQKTLDYFIHGKIDQEQAYDIIRKVLKAEGYDSIAYQNVSEVYHSRNNKDAPMGTFGPTPEPTAPNFSYILFEPTQAKSIFSKGFDPRSNKMSGYIDVSVVPEAIKRIGRLFGIKTSSAGIEFSNKQNGDLFANADEMLQTHKPDSVPDITRYGTNIATVNQVKAMLDHPWVNWAWSSIGKAKREATERFSQYADALHPVFELSRKDQLKLFKTLVDMQAPELAEQRRAAEANDSRAEFLMSQGMEPHLVHHAIRVLDVMKHAYIKDNESTARVGRAPFQLEPMYFPRVHTGKFNLVIRTAENDVPYATGFDSGVDAQKAAAQLKEKYKDKIEAGELYIDVRRNHFGESSDIFASMALEQGVPDFIRAVAAGIEKDIEVAKRTFELHRSKQGVGGYIGELLGNEKTLSGHMQNDKLLNLLQNRLRSSYDWEVRSKIIDNVKSPLFDDGSVMHDKPNLKSFLGQLINRELGHEIGTGKIETYLQKTVEDASKGLDKYFWSQVKGYKGGDLALVSPKSLQETAQAWTYFTSFMKLAANPPVLVANATAIPLVVLDGSRTAAKTGLGQHVALAAYMDTLAYVGHQQQGATEFMKTAAREGMIEPHIAETYDLAETAGRKSKFDHAANYMRNQIEKGTNFTAILYYYNFYKRAAPDLSPEALKAVVYESARSYTGDYSLQAGPLMFSQAGSMGRLMTNFTKWKWNQLGRLADDLKDAKNGNLAPIAINLATQVLVGGIYGASIAVDYEALRRLGKQTGLWDWSPFGIYFDKAKEALAKEGFDPASIEWMRRGALNEGLAKVSDLAGFKTSPDVSGTMRHSSALEAPTVAFGMMKDIFVDALPAMFKALWQAADRKTTGVTTEDKEKMIQALPAIGQGPARHYLNVERKFGKVTHDNYFGDSGEIVTHSKFNDKGIYRRTNAEEHLAMFGLKSPKESNYVDKFYYNTWEKQNRNKQIVERVKGILSNADNPVVLQNNIQELVQLGGPTTVKNLVRQLVKNEMDKGLTADEQAAFAMLQALDPVRKQFILNQMNRLTQ